LFFLPRHWFYDKLSILSKEEKASTFATGPMTLIVVSFENLHLIGFKHYWFHDIIFLNTINCSDVTKNLWSIAFNRNINIYTLLFSRDGFFVLLWSHTCISSLLHFFYISYIISFKEFSFQNLDLAQFENFFKLIVRLF
jgi:hypothetical protein